MHRKMRKLIKAKYHIPAVLICLGLFFLTISYGKSAGLNQTVLEVLSFVFFVVVFIFSGINVINSFKKAWAHFFDHANIDESKKANEE